MIGAKIKKVFKYLKFLAVHSYNERLNHLFKGTVSRKLTPTYVAVQKVHATVCQSLASLNIYFRTHNYVEMLAFFNHTGISIQL